MICPFCQYEFDDNLGRYGCPNCEGEPLDMSARPIIPGLLYAVRHHDQITVVRAAHGVDALMSIFNLFNPEN